MSKTCAARLTLEQLESRNLLAVFQVTNLDDLPVAAAEDAPGTLRQAIFDSNELPGADEIVFADGLAGRIIFTGRELRISDSLNIIGPGADVLSIVGRKILIHDGTIDDAVVSISGLTITAGGGVCCPACDCSRAHGASIHSYETFSIVDSVLTTGGGIYMDGDLYVHDSSFTNLAWERGAIIAVERTVVIENSEISNNFTGTDGSIDVRGGTLLIEQSTISNNRTLNDGGGISCRGCDLTVRRSSIENNVAGPGTVSPQGGGVYFWGNSLTIEDSTLAGNQADLSGGGIAAFGNDLVIKNSTISGNVAKYHGGGVYARLNRTLTNDNRLSINSSTIAGNNTRTTASRTGGGMSLKAVLSGVVEIQNSIVSGNDQRRLREPTAPDIRTGEGVELRITNSLIGHRSDTGRAETLTPDENGNLVGGPMNGVIDPLLAPLANNGGATLTHALLPGSPAINGGDPDFLSPPDYDQRGAPFVRVSAGRIDMGAYEWQPSPADFNGDDQLDCADVDALVTAIAEGGNPVEFDLTGDEIVDAVDLDAWLVLAGIEKMPSREAIPRGDVNLDGLVDASDLNVVGTNWLQNVGGWCNGDFNADFRVDAQDLNMLALNWLKDASGGATAIAHRRVPHAPLAKTAMPAVGDFVLPRASTKLKDGRVAATDMVQMGQASPLSSTFALLAPAELGGC